MNLLADFLLSGGGFVIGVLVGRMSHTWRATRHLPAKAGESDRRAVLVHDGQSGKGPEADEAEILRPRLISSPLAAVLIGLSVVGVVLSGLQQFYRNEDQKTGASRTCQLTAQLVTSRNDSVSANAQLAAGLGKLLSAKDDAASRQALEDLQDYYAMRSVQGSKLPALTAAQIKDCEDGQLDG